MPADLLEKPNIITIYYKEVQNKHLLNFFFLRISIDKP